MEILRVGNMAGSLPVFTASYSKESKQRSEGIIQLEHYVWARGDKKYSVRNWGRGPIRPCLSRCHLNLRLNFEKLLTPYVTAEVLWQV